MLSIIKQDKYVLGQSENIQVKDVADEVKIDLGLAQSIYDVNGGKILGKVLNVNNQVIKYALISLMNLEYKPIYHTFSDEYGVYSIENIKKGSYILLTKAQGYKLDEKNQVSIELGSSTEINIFLQEDLSQQMGVIAGDILNGINNKPVYGAVVTLFKTQVVNNQTIETLESVSYTNEYGQYAFRELSKGDYKIKVNVLGYIKTNSDSKITSNGQVVGLNIGIMEDINTAYGTISGVITDSNNMPINNADVILYKIEKDNSTTPIAFTKTNSSGSYIFIKVQDGNYKISSNKTEIITVNVLKGISNIL